MSFFYQNYINFEGVFMKTVFRTLGVITIAILIGFTMTSCGGDDDDPPHTCTYSNWTTKTAANCVAKEVQERSCSCGNKQTQQVGEINPDGHSYDWVITFGYETETCQYPGCNEINDLILTLELGDTGPAGGIIFYIDPDGFNLYQGTNNTLVLDTYIIAYYLEAWTAREGSYPWSWANQPTASPYEYTDVPLVQQAHDTGNPTQWIGYGLRNTRLIVAAMSSNPIETNRAAQVCINKAVLIGNKTFNDWFLPSIDELNAMYVASTENNVAGLPTMGSTISSSQLDSSYARRQYLDSGYIGLDPKHGASYVFAIRAF